MVEYERVRSWRAYLVEMLDEALEASDLPQPTREALLEARDRYSQGIPTSEAALAEAPLPRHLAFLSKYPQELRERTLARLKAEAPIP